MHYACFQRVATSSLHNSLSEVICGLCPLDQGITKPSLESQRVLFMHLYEVHGKEYVGRPETKVYNGTYYMSKALINWSNTGLRMPAYLNFAPTRVLEWGTSSNGGSRPSSAYRHNAST